MTREYPLGEVPLGFQWEHTFSNHTGQINALAWMPDGQLLVSAGDDGTVRYWNPMSGKEIRQHTSPSGAIGNILLLPAQRQIAVCPTQENMIVIQDIDSGSRVFDLYGHSDPIRALTLTPDHHRIVSASGDHTLRIWGLTRGISHHTLHGHTGKVNSVVISPDGKSIYTGADDGVIRCWDAESGRERDPIGSHHGAVTALALSQDGTMLVSGSEDREICFWEVSSGHLFRILERHTDTILSLAFSPDGRILASRSKDNSLRLWRTDSLESIAMLSEPAEAGAYRSTNGVAFHPYLPMLATLGNDEQHIYLWNLDYKRLFYRTDNITSVHYTTAKVALVGDTGVGKTALGHHMVYGEFHDTVSTHGQQFWVLEQPAGDSNDSGRVEREIVLWDFAGQEDYRLIHSLFLDDVDLVLLVFDASNYFDMLRGVEYWLNQLSQIERERAVKKILVGARTDKGAPRMSPNELGNFCAFYDIQGRYIGTSARTGEGIDELVRTMRELIDWDSMTRTVTTTTFRRIKSYVLNLKADPFWKKMLVTPAELRTQLESLDADWTFTEQEMMTAVRHLENHGYVAVLPGTDMGEVILLAPDLLINLAASMVLEARRNPRGLGALDESKLMSNDYRFPELVALSEKEQTTLREAATMLLVQHHLCFREVSDGRSLLIFPTLINQRRPYHKDLQIYDDITYRVSGAVENIYAALVVQLSYALQSTRNHCWQNQAQFEMGVGEICGFRLVQGKDGEVDLVLYYGVGIPRFTRLRFQELFEKFLNTSKVMYTRYPPIYCPVCDYQQERTIVIKRIEEKRQHLCCVECGTYIDLKRTEDAAILLSESHGAATRREQARTHLRTAFEMALVKIKTMFADREKPPSCFISYAWGSEVVEEWVIRLAHYLREADIEVVLDQQWIRKDLGITLAHFVGELERADYVLVVGTPRYRQKYDQKLTDTGSMVAAEIDLINLRLMGSEDESKTVLPLVLDGDEKTSLPTLLQKRVFSDFRQERFYFVSLFSLILTLYKVSERDPVIVELQSFMKHNARAVM